MQPQTPQPIQQQKITQNRGARNERMAIRLGSSSNRLIPTIVANSTSRERKRPQIFISTNPSHINIESLSNLYSSCSHSPYRLPSSVNDIDVEKLALAVSHSSFVVSVFAKSDSEGRERGTWGRMLPVMERVTPENGELVGFGRAVSDMGLTASIYDVMVIPPLQLMGIGRMIVQRIVRMLTTRGIYDISALCSEKDRLFFKACGFGDDILESTTMMYMKTASSNLDGHKVITEAGRKSSTLLYPS